MLIAVQCVAGAAWAGVIASAFAWALAVGGAGQAGAFAGAISSVLALATLLRMPQGNQVAVVVLGASSNPGRFWETRHLFNWLSQKTTDLLRKDQQDE